MKHYYVVYSYDSGFGELSGFGSCQISYEKKIESIDDVNEIRRYISEQWCGGRSVIVLNWKPIKKSKQTKGTVDDDK